MVKVSDINHKMNPYFFMDETDDLPIPANFRFIKRADNRQLLIECKMENPAFL
jgi:hypothetical protein